MGGLVRQHHPLRDPEAMLLVHHRQPEMLVADARLEDRMRADEDVDRSIRQPHQRRLTRLAFLAPGQDRDIDRHSGQYAAKRLIMLTREDFRWRQQGPLRPCLNRDEQRHQRHQRLARSDIALQQPQHRR